MAQAFIERLGADRGHNMALLDEFRHWTHRQTRLMMRAVANTDYKDEWNINEKEIGQLVENMLEADALCCRGNFLHRILPRKDVQKLREIMLRQVSSDMLLFVEHFRPAKDVSVKVSKNDIELQLSNAETMVNIPSDDSEAGDFEPITSQERANIAKILKKHKATRENEKNMRDSYFVRSARLNAKCSASNISQSPGAKKTRARHAAKTSFNLQDATIHNKEPPAPQADAPSALQETAKPSAEVSAPTLCSLRSACDTTTSRTGVRNGEITRTAMNRAQSPTPQPTREVTPLPSPPREPPCRSKRAASSIIETPGSPKRLHSLPVLTTDNNATLSLQPPRSVPSTASQQSDKESQRESTPSLPSMSPVLESQLRKESTAPHSEKVASSRSPSPSPSNASTNSVSSICGDEETINKSQPQTTTPCGTHSASVKQKAYALLDNVKNGTAQHDIESNNLPHNFRELQQSIKRNANTDIKQWLKTIGIIEKNTRSESRINHVMRRILMEEIEQRFGRHHEKFKLLWKNLGPKAPRTYRYIGRLAILLKDYCYIFKNINYTFATEASEAEWDKFMQDVKIAYKSSRPTKKRHRSELELLYIGQENFERIQSSSSKNNRSNL